MLTVEGEGDGLERHVRQANIETGADCHWDDFLSVNGKDDVSALVQV
jgi:hypothetical protein